ncbi:MAG: DUF4364 family protein [Tissierellaceae bacterium]|jgi:predicted transcriptional regulator|nr:DUF4364 family protein [Tissierellia bacterium]
MFSENSEELAQNKLILLYIVREAGYGFTKDEITEFILKKNYMNFFSIQQYLSELVDSSFIDLVENQDRQEYKLQEKGKTALEYFSNKIPDFIKEDLETEFQAQRNQAKKETQVLAEHYQNENGQYVVNLKLIENEDTLFSLYLNLVSLEQVEIVSNAWKERTESIYAEIIKLLTE